MPTPPPGGSGCLHLPVAAVDRPLLRFSPRQAYHTLLGIITFFVVMNLLQLLWVEATHGQSFGRLAKLFDTDGERNFPSVYSASALALAGLISEVIARLCRRQGRAWVGHWRSLGVLFVVLGLDEFCSLHELTNVPLGKAIHASASFRIAWVIPGMIFVLLVSIAYLKWLLALPVRTRVLGVLSAAIFIGGAVGMEMVGSAVVMANKGVFTMMYNLCAALEECMEMVGVGIWIYAQLDYISQMGGPSVALGVELHREMEKN